MEEPKKKSLTAKKESDFSEWYTQVLTRSDFIDYTSVSGSLAFRPDSYFIWEMIQKALDVHFKSIGVQNAYFPLLIPEHLLNKEKEHVKGFSPEVAWVTQTGDSKLDERLAVRPTSETIMYDSFSKWIRSWRDLPLRLNLFNSVLRWEFKHPTPFLRSREFLWNEGHTVFATKEEADSERDVILNIYNTVLREQLAIPGITGRKTANEKFPGAVATYSIEHLLPDGNAIQGPDFHSDGQNFSKAFEIAFIDKEENKAYAYQNTFGFTTREIGVMIAIHSDNHGLVIPPNVSRIQVVIVPIYKNENREKVLEEARYIYLKLKPSLRVYLDDRDAYSPGWKFNEWELKGVPIRIEIGEKEIKSKRVVAMRRDTLQKSEVPIKSIEKDIESLLNDINENLYKKAKKDLESRIHKATTLEQLKKIFKTKNGIAEIPWCGSEKCEAKIKEQTGAKIISMPMEKQDDARGKKCAICGEDAKHVADVAKSY